MAELPLLATDRVALAIREGHQTQDRRPVRLAEFGPSDTPAYDFTFRDRRALWNDFRRETLIAYYAPWQPGDLLYVREAHRFGRDRQGFIQAVQYRADMATRNMLGHLPSGKYLRWADAWRPNIHHCKAHARTWVRVSRVWVERVRDISEADAQAEGFEDWAGFGAWWANQYGGRAWFGNQFVWCCEFEREEQGR